ncbi:MAG: hypothetical protein QOG79_244 [Mycobacterium sp.]|nr:hypothetical protein [Mycobacterium sp.]
MLTSFWTSIGSKLGERFLSAAAPALVFWLGGAGLWLISNGGKAGIKAGYDRLDHASAGLQLVALVVTLLTVGASGMVVSFCATTMVRVLEGYWPPLLNPLRDGLVAVQQCRANRLDSKWQALAPRQNDPSATASERSTLGRLERKLRQWPADPNQFMPTRIGNILRAAETRPADKYGLDAVVIWPRLWPLLADSARSELTAARAALDAAAAAVIWGLLFCLFTVTNGWALPIGLLVTLVASTVVMPARANVFGELVEASVDLYRADLYRKLRWALPDNAEAEHERGRQLTAYLWRGSDSDTITFLPDKT